MYQNGYIMKDKINEGILDRFADKNYEKFRIIYIDKKAV
jgi:hypothetical protein